MSKKGYGVLLIILGVLLVAIELPSEFRQGQLATTPRINPISINTGPFAGNITPTDGTTVCRVLASNELTCWLKDYTTTDGITVCAGEHLAVNNGRDIGIIHKISVVVYSGAGGTITFLGLNFCWYFPSNAQQNINTFIQQNANTWEQGANGLCSADYDPCTGINVVNYP